MVNGWYKWYIASQVPAMRQASAVYRVPIAPTYQIASSSLVVYLINNCGHIDKMDPKTVYLFVWRPSTCR